MKQVKKKTFKPHRYILLLLVVVSATFGIGYLLGSFASLPVGLGQERKPNTILLEASQNLGYDDSDTKHVTPFEFELPDFRVYGDGTVICVSTSGEGLRQRYSVKTKKLNTTGLTNFAGDLQNSKLYDTDKDYRLKRVILSHQEQYSVTLNLPTAKRVILVAKEHSKEIEALARLKAKTCVNATEFVPEAVILETSRVTDSPTLKNAPITRVMGSLFPPILYQRKVTGDKAKELYRKFAGRAVFAKVTTDKNRVYKLTVEPIFREFEAPKIAKVADPLGIIDTAHAAANKPVSVLRMIAIDQVDTSDPKKFPTGLTAGNAMCASVRSYFNSQIGRQMTCASADASESQNTTDRVGKFTMADYKSDAHCQRQAAYIAETFDAGAPCGGEQNNIWTSTFAEFYQEGTTTIVMVSFGSWCRGSASAWGIGDKGDGYGVAIKIPDCNGSTKPSKTQLVAHEGFHAMAHDGDHTTISNNLMKGPYACAPWDNSCTMTTSQKEKLKQTPYFFTDADVTNDKTKPGRVPNLTSDSNQTANRINLYWDAASDNSGSISYYKIYNYWDGTISPPYTNKHKNPDCSWIDFSQHGYTGRTSRGGEEMPAPVTRYIADGLAEDSKHSFFVTAVDPSGNESPKPSSASSCDYTSAPTIKQFKTLAEEPTPADDVVDDALQAADEAGHI